MSSRNNNLSNIHPTILQISSYLDQNIYFPLYKKDAGTFELPLSGLAKLTKVSENLIPVKVGSAGLGALCCFTFLRLFSSNQMNAFFYLIIAIDLFRVSYNSYGRQYLSLLARNTLENPRDLSAAIMSLFSSPKKSEDFLTNAAERINWPLLAEGTISLRIYNEVS